MFKKIIGLFSKKGYDQPEPSSDSEDSLAASFQDELKEANQGNADAQYYLGVLYKNGEGVRQDYAEAIKWFKLAADQGDASAQFYLGLMYYDGEGVRQDYAEAKEWFGKSCDNGSRLGCKLYRELNNL